MRFILTAVLVAVVFILTDHRRDLIGIGASNGEIAGPAWETTIARLTLMGFAMIMAVVAGNRPEYRRSPASLAVGAMMFYGCATMLWSVDPAFTLRKLIVAATVVVTAWCLSLVFDLDRIADLIFVVFTGYLLLGIAVELISGNVQYLRVFRFEGTTGANQNGMFAAVISLIAGLRLLVGARSRRRTIGYALVLALAAVITVVTISRSAMVALAAASITVVVLTLFSPQATRRFKMVLGSVGVGVVGLVAVAITTNHRSTNLGGFGYRSSLWEPLWEAIQQRPVQGYGYLGYWVSGSRNRVGNSHSVYIDLLLDGGAIFLVLYLLAVGLVLFRLISANRSATNVGTLFSIALVVFALVHGLVESMFHRPTIANFFLLCVLLRALQPERSPAAWLDPTHSRATAVLSGV